jgi:competence protein ComEC
MSPLFSHRLKFLPEKFKIREIVISTLATQIFVLPFLIYTMGDVSLVGLPVNILILGLIPATMFFGFLSGMFAFIHFVTALPVAYLTTLLLSYELGVVHLFSSFSFASISFPTFSTPFMVMIYVFYGYILWKFHKKKPLTVLIEKR